MAADPYQPSPLAGIAGAAGTEAASSAFRRSMFLVALAVLLLPLNMLLIFSIPYILPIGLRIDALRVYSLILPVACTVAVTLLVRSRTCSIVAVIMFTLAGGLASAVNLGWLYFVSTFWQNLGSM